jgi:hypothetical protein
MYEVIFGVLTLFCCLWTYFIVCGLAELVGLVHASFLFMRIIFCLCLHVGTC